MKKIAFAIAAVGAIALTGTGAALAGHQAHRGMHEELNHRGYHRELVHRDAHRYPQTWRQHERLHESLDHEAYHNRVDHRSSHRSFRTSSYRRRDFGYGRSGFGFSGRSFFIRFSR